MSNRDSGLAAALLKPPVPVKAKIIELRGGRVIFDYQLAVLFEVTTGALNQTVKRNLKRFPADWAFQITLEEYDDLISQNVISKGEWGGRRKLPWAFSEHGVVMVASVLRSDRATAVMQHVVAVFIAARKQAGFTPLPLQAGASELQTSGSSAFSNRLQGMIERLMEAIVDHENDKTVRDEAMQVFQQSIEHIKSKLSRAGFENQEIAAKAAKLLSEAEANKAVATKTRAEAEEIALRTLANRLRLVLEAEQAMASGELDGFIDVLNHLG